MGWISDIDAADKRIVVLAKYRDKKPIPIQ